jgi:Bacterial transcriptional activator domain
VLTGGADRAGIPALAGLALGGDRGAVLVTDVYCDGALVLRRDGDELVIGDTGVRVRPLPWTPATTVALAGLLAEPPAAAAGTPDGPASELPDWTAMVRLLGPVALVREDGAPVELSVKALELLSWLAARGGRGRRADAEAALYPSGNERAFAATMSETRTALRTLGTELLGRDGGELALPGEIISDLDVFRWFTQRGTRAGDDREACGQLEQALSLVRGVPLAGLEHAVWPDAERHTDRLAHEVVRAVLAYGRHGLAAGLTADVLAAAELGLQVVPGQQHLVCLKVDAHLQHDDVEAASAELDRLREVVSHDDAEGGDLCADAVDRIRIVHGRRSA